MCGIGGVVNFDQHLVQSRTLEEMASKMSHRGPDGQGIYNKNGIGLVHRRLAIMDPELGHQPVLNESGSIVLTFNGEIYNYLEIRKELELSYNFRTNTDTEVLLRAYEAWGIDCITKFKGMFAFGLLDRVKGRIFIVRDRLGIKPLYYTIQSDLFSFASELDALLPTIHDPRISKSAVADYLRWQYVPTPKSIYENVCKLEAGHYLELNLNNYAISNIKYWQINIKESENKSDKEWIEELNEILDRIIKVYVRSDVPFGSFLSGGVDSSLVTALMSRVLDKPVKTFSIGFNERELSELKYARRASELLKTNSFEKIVSPSSLLELIAEIACGFGEPFGDSSALPTYIVSKITSNQVKMVLSGDGGDELFGGYNSYLNTYSDLIKKRKRNRLLEPLISGLNFWPFSKIVPEPINVNSLTRKHIEQRDVFNERELNRLLKTDFNTDWPVKNLNKSSDVIKNFQVLDAQTYMVDDVLTKVDRMSMKNSLEVRVPLLDHEVVEFAAKLPLEMKLRNVQGQIVSKFILKKSAERFFPLSFLERPKMGFGIPVIEWCRIDLKDIIQDKFLNKDSLIYEFVNQDYVIELVNNFFSGDDSLGAKIWVLLMFQLWLEKSVITRTTIS